MENHVSAADYERRSVLAAELQWRKPGPKFGGTKKILPSPQIQKFGGTARNSLFLATKQLNIE